MKHRPAYITANAPYVRPATYEPPPPAPAGRHAPLVTWNPIWRWLAYAVAAVALLGMFAYGVIVIRTSAPATHGTGSTWVTPTTYGPPEWPTPRVAVGGER